MNVPGFVLFAAMSMASAAAQPAWYPFHWISTATPGLQSDRAAIMVPVALDGTACTMQLDTGVGVSVLYRHSLPARYAVRDEQLVVDAFTVGPLQMRHGFHLIYDDVPAQRGPACLDRDATRVAGTLGNNIFAGGRLTLDLHNARYRFTSAAVPVASQEQTGVPLTMMTAGDGRGQVPAIDAVLADGRHVLLLFDTGSAAAELGVFREADWLALVGEEGARNAVVSSPMAWGRPLHCRAAPIRHPLRVGPIVLDAHTHALFCAGEYGPIFDKMAQFGLIGLVPFSGKVITVDYVARRLSVSAPETP